MNYPQRVREILAQAFGLFEDGNHGIDDPYMSDRRNEAAQEILDLITEAQTQELLNTLKFAEGGQVHEDFIISRIKELKPKTGDQ